MSLNTPSVILLAAQARTQLPYKQVAFEQLAELSYPFVRRIAYGITGNRDDAETISQEVLLRVFHHLPRLEEPERYAGWIRKITVNTCNTHLARERRESLKRAAYANFAQALVEPESGAHDTELKSFADMVQGLSIDERTIVAFKILEDLGFKEIAELTGSTTSATKMRYYRALDKIRSTTPTKT